MRSVASRFSFAAQTSGQGCPRSSNMNISEEVKEAYERIGPHIRKTRLERSRFYSEKTGANVFLKMENLQHTRVV